MIIPNTKGDESWAIMINQVVFLKLFKPLPRVAWKAGKGDGSKATSPGVVALDMPICIHMDIQPIVVQPILRIFMIFMGI